MNERNRPEKHRIDPLKQLSRTDYQKAFGRMDDEFHDRVRQTLFLIEEKEEEPVKKKMTFSMALAFAMCLCLVVTAFAVALPNSEQPDITQPLSQGETDKPQPMPTVTPRIMAESTPRPTPMPTLATIPAKSTPTPMPNPEIEFVWSAVSDEAYHSIRECFAAHQGLTRIILSVAINRQQTPCAYCFVPAYDAATPTPMPTLATIPPKSTSTPQTDTDIFYVYYTKDGVNYHTNPECSGMRNATTGTIAQALNLNKTACTVCTMVQSTPQPTPNPLWDGEIVYVTDYNGRYFHFDKNCMNMTGAYYECITDALGESFEPCPLCVQGGEIYLTEYGVYFHVKEDCIPYGMGYECGSGSVEELLKMGRTPCPMCYEPSSKDITYWTTSKDNLYHASLECTHTHMPVNSSSNTPFIIQQMTDYKMLIDGSVVPCPDCILLEPLVERKSDLPSSDIPTFLESSSIKALDEPQALVFTARGFDEGEWAFSDGLMGTSVQDNDQLTVNSVVMLVARGSLYLEVEFVVTDPALSPYSVRFLPYSETDGSPEIEYATVREFTYENGEIGYLLCQLTESPSDEYGDAGHFRIYGGETAHIHEYIADFR